VNDLQVLLDEREIKALTLRYAECIDTRDWDTFRTLFTDQVQMESNLRATPPAVLDVDTLIARVGPQNDQFLVTLHYIGNHLIEITDDTAACRSYLYAPHVLTGDADEERFVAYGRYVHSFRRTPEGWRICGISITLDIRDGEVPTPQEVSPH
jgi:3-phenylpropionate/cinnamic acid dioxygenase small subunit